MTRKKSAEPTATTATETHDQVDLTLPLGNDEQPGTYQRELVAGGAIAFEARGVHLNVQLGSKAAAAFARVRNGFRAAGVRLPDGRPVWSNADALRYLFEAVADAAG